MKLLKNLTILMAEKGINRTELAKEIGIAPSTINSWYNRNCDNISLSTLLKLSKYFNVSMEDLVNGNPSSYIIFNDIEYTSKELEIIKQFGSFLKDNRIDNEERTL